MGYVYRYMRGDEWIYVGKTSRPLSFRIEAHKKEKKFSVYLPDCKIYFCEFEHDSDMSTAESVLIKHYKPILNVSGKNPTPFPFAPNMNQIKWFLYDDVIAKKRREHQIDILKKWRAKLIPYVHAYCAVETEKFVATAAKEVSHFAMQYALKGSASHISLRCPAAYRPNRAFDPFSYWGITYSVKDEHFIVRIPSREKCETIIQRCGASIEVAPTLIGIKQMDLERKYVKGISGERAIRLAHFIEAAIKNITNVREE